MEFVCTRPWISQKTSDKEKIHVYSLHFAISLRRPKSSNIKHRHAARHATANYADQEKEHLSKSERDQAVRLQRGAATPQQHSLPGASEQWKVRGLRLHRVRCREPLDETNNRSLQVDRMPSKYCSYYIEDDVNWSCSYLLTSTMLSYTRQALQRPRGARTCSGSVP